MPLLCRSFQTLSRFLVSNPLRMARSVRKNSTFFPVENKFAPFVYEWCVKTLAVLKSKLTKASFFQKMVSTSAITSSAATLVYFSSELKTIKAKNDSICKDSNEHDPHSPLPLSLCNCLHELLGERFSQHIYERESHGKDLVGTYHTSRMPQAVAFPLNTQEVAEIVRLCNHYCVPIIPYGSGL